MGVGMACLTSFGLMASFWPESRREGSNQGNASRHSGGGHCCGKRKRVVPDSCEHAAPLLVDEEADSGQLVTESEDGHPRGPAAATTSRLRGTQRLLQLAGGEALYLWVGVAVLLIRLPFSLAIPNFVATTITCLVDEDYDGARRQVLLIFCLGTVDVSWPSSIPLLTCALPRRCMQN